MFLSRCLSTVAAASGAALLLALLSAAPAPAHAQQATRGVTDGEPGSGAHCCGMKGLGGAKVDVLCHPQQVAAGQSFTVNANFMSDVKRPVDLHVDVLNAETKEFYAGKWVEFDTQAGAASLTIDMPYNVREPFLWKVFLAPRGEPFPNMLAETGFVSHLGPNVVGNCESFKSYGWNPPEMADNDQKVDYVMLTAYPADITPGGRAVVDVEYNLASVPAASISAALMRKGPNLIISSAADAAKPGQHTTRIAIPVPSNAPKEAVYIVATLTPAGGSWENRLAEDRTYRTKLVGAGGRALRA